jgi:hypothetical protein
MRWVPGPGHRIERSLTAARIKCCPHAYSSSRWALCGVMHPTKGSTTPQNRWWGVSARNLDRSTRSLDRSVRNLDQADRNLDRSIRNLDRSSRNLDRSMRNLDKSITTNAYPHKSIQKELPLHRVVGTPVYPPLGPQNRWTISKSRK